MSGTTNRVILVGRLGKDPESTAVGDKTVCKFSLATDESYTKAGGDKVSKTSWHNIVAWAKLAETCQKYLKKGALIYCEGKLDYRKWQDNEGNEKRATDIVINNMTMLGSKPDSDGGSSQTTKKKDDGWGDNKEDDSEIPF